MPSTHPPKNPTNQGPTSRNSPSTHSKDVSFGPARATGPTHPATNTANRGRSGPGTNQHAK
jgi:hypothetical protein